MLVVANRLLSPVGAYLEYINFLTTTMKEICFYVRSLLLVVRSLSYQKVTKVQILMKILVMIQIVISFWEFWLICNFCNLLPFYYLSQFVKNRIRKKYGRGSNPQLSSRPTRAWVTFCLFWIKCFVESLGAVLKFPFSSLSLSYTAPRSPHEM